MPSRVLADSNILLRVAQPSHVHHALVLSAMDKLLRQDFNLYVVTQNLVEFWAVATRPLTFNCDDFKRYLEITVLHRHRFRRPRPCQG